ncbi:MAG: GNAT family N-acetyltransferase [Bryobacteraceae bacterium]
MVRIEPVTPQSSPELLDQARALFRSYGDFLRTSGGPALFCFSRLDDEIASLPAAYVEHGGELLLACDGAQSAGCIAYRTVGSSQPTWCEIKRLYVSSAFRGQGIGRLLVRTAITRARQNGYKIACLDTEPRSMAVAKQMYLALGFALDEERNSRTENSLVTYLKKDL